MTILVLGGSPKGSESVTLQSVRWLERRFPRHRFVFHHVAQRIRRLETDPAALDEVLAGVRSADLVIWAFPVYYFLVHAHLKRFIELTLEGGAKEAFDGRYGAAISTSIHFFDQTAHEYLHGISEDLGMKWLGSFSAHMRDLTSQEERQRLELFFRHVVEDVARRAPVVAAHPALEASDWVYEPDPVPPREPLDVGGRRVVVLTDQTSENPNLAAMVRRFSLSFARSVQVVNLHDVDIKASCQGCLHCAYDNQCIFEGKDGFTTFYRDTVEAADVLVFAGTIRDRYLSSRWKTYFDRSFFENHRPTLRGRQIALLTSGPLRQLSNLGEILTAYVQVQEANLVGWVTDEVEDSATLDALIDDLALRSARTARDRYVAPRTFLGVGGHKIFRDAVYGWMRVPFVSDHRTYKKLGLYDFPQKNWKVRFRNALYLSVFRMPSVRERVYGNLKRMMVQEHERIVEEDG